MQLPLIFALSVGLGLSLSFSRADDDPMDEPLPLEKVEEIGCVECHREIALEWADTMHAKAWIDPIYQKSVKSKRRPGSCYGCHVPLPLHLGKLDRKPKARTEELEAFDHGISCVTCHAGPDDTILGPFGAATEAHVSVQSELFESPGRDRLCSSCHRTNIGPVIGVAKDFEATGQADKGRSCVGCHMDVSIRKIADYDQNEPLMERKGRSHRINGPSDPEFLERAFQLSLSHAKQRTTLSIANGAGHRVPALVGRSFELTAVLLDAEGTEIERQEIAFDNYSFLDVSQPYLLRFKRQGTAVRVTAQHLARIGAEPVSFLDQRVTQ